MTSSLQWTLIYGSTDVTPHMSRREIVPLHLPTSQNFFNDWWLSYSLYTRARTRRDFIPPWESCLAFFWATSCYCKFGADLTRLCVKSFKLMGRSKGFITSFKRLLRLVRLASRKRHILHSMNCTGAMFWLGYGTVHCPPMYQNLLSW